MKNLEIKRVVVACSRKAGRYIRFSPNGQIAVSAEAVRTLKIGKDDKAVFFQDKNDPKDWYFSFGKQGDYELRNKGKENDDTMQFSNSGLRTEIATAIEFPKKTVRLWLSKDPIVIEGKNIYKLNYRD